MPSSFCTGADKLFISCSKDTKTVTDYTAKNEQEIKDYLAKNNLTAQRSTSGLYYIINEQGTGTQPTAASNVTVADKAYFTNRKKFYQSKRILPVSNFVFRKKSNLLL